MCRTPIISYLPAGRLGCVAILAFFSCPDRLAAQEFVDLAEEDVAALPQSDGHLLANPWYQNFDLWGFAAVGFLDTGNAGTRPHGGFLVKEATIFLEAEVWENISLFTELQTNRLGQDDRLFVRTGEVHAHFRDLFPDWSDASLGLKVGRVDIPFGEEYLWQDAVDNPLISNSAVYPYGFDEGVLLYGDWRGIGWVLSALDGSDTRSLDDDSEQSWNAKVYGSPTQSLYTSLSLMKTGSAAKSALEFGGSHLQPIGASHPSSLGASPSSSVDGSLYEFDARYDFDDRGYVAASFGQAFISDAAAGFDRDLRWFTLEPFYEVSESAYLVLRYSEIGTYDAAAGYHFDGKILAGGNGALGYDSTRLRRLSLGAGWRPNPRVLVKFEIGQDWFDLIDASTFSANNDNRLFAGFELVLQF